MTLACGRERSQPPLANPVDELVRTISTVGSSPHNMQRLLEESSGQAAECKTELEHDALQGAAEGPPGGRSLPDKSVEREGERATKRR